jgi:hypothetical protein
LQSSYFGNSAAVDLGVPTPGDAQIEGERAGEASSGCGAAGETGRKVSKAVQSVDVFCAAIARQHPVQSKASPPEGVSFLGIVCKPLSEARAGLACYNILGLAVPDQDFRAMRSDAKDVGIGKAVPLAQ